MIKITVELVSAISGNTSVLGVAHIANDGQGTVEKGDYAVKLSKFGGKGLWKSGWVKGFARQRLGGWDLLFRALQGTVGYRNKQSLVSEQEVPMSLEIDMEEKRVLQEGLLILLEHYGDTIDDKKLRVIDTLTSELGCMDLLEQAALAS